MSELRLKTRLERIGDFIVLHYSVESHTDRDAYLLNRVRDNTLRTDADLIYIELDHSSKLVRASKKIPDLPSDFSPTMPLTPSVTPLRAGKIFEESVRIPLPVREYKAYLAVPQDGRKVPYVGMTFSLEYYWGVPGMKEHTEQLIPGVDVLIPVAPPRTTLESGDLNSGVMPFDIEVWETS